MSDPRLLERAYRWAKPSRGAVRTLPDAERAIDDLRNRVELLQGTQSVDIQRNQDVREWGAIGDGIADDTAAIQRAIDFWEREGGGVPFFPTGLYKVTDTLTVPSSVVLLGQNPLTSVIELSVTGIPCVTNEAGASNFAIGRLGFQLSPGTVSTGTTGILVDTTSNVLIQECIVSAGELLRPGVAINRFDVAYDVADSSSVTTADCKGTSDVATYRAIANAAAGTFSGNQFSRCRSYTEDELTGSSSALVDYVVDGSGGANLQQTLFFFCSSTDAGTDAFLQDGTNVSGSTYIACTATDPALIGYDFIGTNTASDTSLRDCIAVRTGRQGYLMAAGNSGITMVACTSVDAGSITAGAGDGYLLSGADQLIENCVAIRARGQGGIFIDSAAESEVIGCKALDGLSTVGGMVMGAASSKIHFVDNVVRNQTGGQGYHVAAGTTEFQIVSCYVDGAQVAGFAVLSGCSNFLISGCTARNQTFAHGFTIVGTPGNECTDFLVTGCLSEGNGAGGDGFNLQHCQDFQMVGNLAKGNTLAGMRLFTCGGDYHICHNLLIGNTGGNLVETVGTPTAHVEDNDIGQLAPPTLDLATATVYAAGILTLPNFPDIFFISNTTGGPLPITGMTASYSGREVFLMADPSVVTANAITFDETGNLNLDTPTGTTMVWDTSTDNPDRVEMYCIRTAVGGKVWVEETRSGA